MHPKNKHIEKYKLDELSAIYPLLGKFTFTNKYQTKTIDFASPKAVKALNTALLKKDYHINFWNFPDKNLCPPIPSRVDYIHHLSDLINNSNEQINVLDIGTGATCIYPLIGNSVYNWDFVGTDIDSESIDNAQKIIDKNNLNQHIKLRLQLDKNNILKGIVNTSDKFTFSMCNPPFYKSKEEALHANYRKVKNLKLQINERNFSGNSNELWYQGGEKAFLHNYIYQSVQYKDQFKWFTSLISKKDLIKDLKRSLKKLDAKDVKIIEMEQGNKISRILAWRW